MNCRPVNKYKEDYDVYIGRGSIWGNPFVIGKDGNREQVIEKFKEYFKEMIKTKQITLDDLLKLKDKRLGCFCHPKPCHGTS